ncbi:copper resistance protein CopC [Acrocarpospora sp. B8E8]|uniref:copper resistance CopC family protein n=1 Tax=Acrocarpospora sp. B8E8 TaxID=3153572 RepID=UPI00325E36F6
MASLPRFVRNSLAAALACGLFLAIPAAPAAAHDRLKSSNPAKNAKVDSVETITLDFTSKVRFPAVVLMLGDEKIDLGKPKLDGTKVRTEVPEALASGKYTIAWRVVSVDGHPIEGEIPFTVKADPSPSPSPESTPTSSPTEAVSAPVTPTPVTTFSEASGEEETADGSGVPGWLWIGGGILVVVGVVVWFSTGRKANET